MEYQLLFTLEIHIYYSFYFYFVKNSKILINFIFLCVKVVSLSIVALFHVGISKRVSIIIFERFQKPPNTLLGFVSCM